MMPMRLPSTTIPTLALLLASALSSSAFGAEYHCNGDGVSWISRTPCPNTPRNEMRAYGGGTAQPSVTPSAVPSLPKAPEYLPYMSVECAELNDAIRTGPTRGLRTQAMTELTDDYRKRCRDDEANARRQLQDAEAAQKNARDGAAAAVKARKAESARNDDQCYEMLRILHAKRQRAASMNEGEKADLLRFEDAYRTRCPRG